MALDPGKTFDMGVTLSLAIDRLRAHEAELRRRGVRHAAVFGSVARAEASPTSDVDILVDIDPAHGMDLIEYADLKLYLADLFQGAADVVNGKTLKPLLRDSILRDAVSAF